MFILSHVDKSNHRNFDINETPISLAGSQSKHVVVGLIGGCFLFTWPDCSIQFLVSIGCDSIRRTIVGAFSEANDEVFAFTKKKKIIQFFEVCFLL